MRFLLRQILGGGDRSNPDEDRSALPAAVDLLWDEGQRRLAAQSDRLTRLDSKTTPLLGFGVAVAAFFQTNAERIGSEDAHLGTAFAALGLLATLGVMAPRTIAYAPRFRTFLRGARRSPQELKTRYLGNLRTAIEQNDAALEAKTVWFKLGIGIYFSAIILAIIAMLSQLWPSR
jgi:hypothetical protein